MYTVMIMKSRNLLAEISRQFLKEHKVYKYRMKKVSEMSDDDVIMYCHWYCEENRLNDEWRAFRKNIESKYKFCQYYSEYVDDESCEELQMILNGFSNKTEYSDIDKEKLQENCKECKYCW